MPKLSNSTPKYRKHRASGQAIVSLSGKDFYLGPHGTKASHAEYDRLVAEWLQAGRCLADEAEPITVVELLAVYKRFAESYYRKNGEPTREVGCIVEAARFVTKLYSRTPASEFGPLSLQVVQTKMTEAGLSRGVINNHTGRIKRMFKWGVAQELLPAASFQALQAVGGLRKGRCDARETDPVLPVSNATVEATLPKLREVVADMVRFQRLTGCRPGEVCALRPCDVDTSGDVWSYRLESHKTEHHERERVVFIGPRAQDVLRPYLLREATAYCFSPADSERKRRREQHAERKTPLAYGNSPGTNRKKKPKRSAGDYYTNNSYRRAVHRACDLAFPPATKLTGDALKQWRSEQRWSPNQLRHSAATEIRKRFGLEAAQVTLGHANANVTQVYAERDMEKAAAIMREVG